MRSVDPRATDVSLGMNQPVFVGSKPREGLRGYVGVAC